MAVERVRVLRVIARLNAGGPAHHVGILSAGLTRRGFDTILAHGSVPSGETMLAGFDERFRTRRVEIPELGPQLTVRDGRALRRLIGQMRAFRPHIVHTHTAKAGFIGRVAALAVRPRPVIVHTYHGHVLEGYFPPVKQAVYRGLERVLAHASDCLVGVSSATISDLQRLRVGRHDRFRLIPLGLELDGFLASDRSDGEVVRQELGLGPDAVVALMVGRLVPIKRHDVALEVLAAARRRTPALHLAIAGDGPLRPDLERRARSLGIERHVSFLGYRSDLVPLAAASDIALLTSRSEGTPVALIEAAAAARPSVTTRVGGVEEVVTPATGRLVEEGDVEGLTTALTLLAGDPELRERLGAAARARVRDRYDAKRLLVDVERLYRELLDGRAGG